LQWSPQQHESRPAVTGRRVKADILLCESFCLIKKAVELLIGGAIARLVQKFEAVSLLKKNEMVKKSGKKARRKVC